MRFNPKVFFIGFNKCGTKSVTHLFRANGYRAMHCRARPLIFDYIPRRFIPRRFWLKHTVSAAQLIEDNLAAGRPVLRGMRLYHVYSDLTHVRQGRVIEACRQFSALHSAYPDAYFVLNVRPVEKWIRSRVAHRNGDFLRRYAEFRHVSESAVIDEWRGMFAAHTQEVTAYFDGSPRFMVYDIESDAPERLQTLLKPDFDLKLTHWQQKGATKDSAWANHRVADQAVKDELEDSLSRG